MYLIDTNIISEARKKDKTDPDVWRFFVHVEAADTPIYLSVVTIGELRRGIELHAAGGQHAADDFRQAVSLRQG